MPIYLMPKYMGVVILTSREFELTNSLILISGESSLAIHRTQSLIRLLNELKLKRMLISV